MTGFSIRDYFGDKAMTRDLEFDQHPILGFEQRMRQRALLELLAIDPNDRVVDIGCGNLRDFPPMLAGGARYFGVDLTETMLREGLKKHPELVGRVVVADATHLPFLPGSLDKVALSELIEHIPAYEEALRESARCVRSGGAVVVTTPNRRSLYGLARWVSERITPWQHPYDVWKSTRELAAATAAAGLTIDRRLGAVYTPYIYGLHIPRPLQRAMVGAGVILDALLRTLVPSYGYLLAIRGRKR